MGNKKRSHAANSLYWYSFYLLITGLVLFIYPKPLVMLVGSQTVDPAWRIVGMFLIVLGLIVQQVVRMDHMTPLYKLTVYNRTGVLIVLTGFVLAGMFNAVIILLGVIDFGAAMWTLWGIKKDAQLAEPARM